jgi:PilZ domain
MANKRGAARLRRRLRVCLGSGGTLFTADVSPGGFCVHVAAAFTPGTPVSGELALEQDTYPFQGIVSWVRPGDARLGLHGRMGVRFTTVPEVLRRRLAPVTLGGPARPALPMLPPQ